MAVLKIVNFPNPTLKKTSEFVKIVDDKIRKIMDNMIETMYNNNGVGLAAVQVGILKRILVMDVKYSKENGIITEGEKIFMVNPEIVEKSKEQSTYNEGCLSFPTIQAEIKRPKKVKIKFLDYFGNVKFLDCDELLSTCVQHEIDHLNGITFVDYLSKLKREILLKKYHKNHKE
jgi:peptide deformylase